MFYSVQYKNGLAASDVLHVFTQSIKFYKFHYYTVQMLKNVIHQLDSKNERLLFSASFRV